MNTTIENTVVEKVDNVAITVSEVEAVVAPQKKESVPRKKSAKVPDICMICCEKFNKSVHIPIECMHCQFKSCRKCCETYILGESLVKCMNGECGREWTRKFIRESFTHSFIVGPLKKWREDLLYDKERALLPATQPYVEAINRRKDIQKDVEKLENQISKLRRGVIRLQRESTALERNPLLITQGAEVMQEYLRGNRNVANVEGAERRQFIKPCPVDDCRGFLSSQWKCGTCNIWTCPDCHMIIGDTKETAHTCDPNNVETAKMLKAETKPCPKCAAAIYKIDGCDQMWCVMCHTAFSWRTGKIEENIHNPHYYEWLRRTQGSVPRNPLDMQCGGHNNLNGQFWRNIDQIMNFKKLNEVNPRLYTYCRTKMSNIERYTLHNRMVTIPRLQAFDYEKNNRDLRIDYLLNKVQPDAMKMLIQRAEKKTLKESETREVYIMVCNTGEDIIMRFAAYIDELAPNSQFNSHILDEMNKMLEYANECMEDISKTYQCRYYKFITDDTNFMSINYNR
jgi:hypothetical protein